MAERRCSDLIEAWLRYTENSESSRRYHKWAAYSCIAGVLQRKVYIRWGHTTIFPNHYIVLLGPSGRARKGEPIEIAKRMLSRLGVPLASEAVTRQQLIRRIGLSFVKTGGPPGYSIGHCSMTSITGEFAAFLGEGDTQFLVDLTDWYDSRDKWTYDTKHGGTDEIIGVCFNILGAMAPDWIPHCIPQGAIGGGFTSRLLWVVSHSKERLIPNPNSFALDEGLERDILHDLEAILAMDGEFAIHVDALKYYEDWYITEERRVTTGSFPLVDPRFSGYIARRATHVKKIAMGVAASKRNDLIIFEEDMRKAVWELEDIERDFAVVFAGIGDNPHVRPQQAIIDLIKTKVRVTKSEIARTFCNDLTNQDLQSIEDMLVTMRIIKIERDALSGETHYNSTEGASAQATAPRADDSPHPSDSTPSSEPADQ